MKMIVGLGNIGTEYDETRHNVGFMTVDQMAHDYQFSAFKHEKAPAVTTTGLINGEKVMLVKPTTYMNESGRAVKPLMDYYDVDLADVVIISDDLDMQVGKVRFKQQGSAGGHNGLKSIIAHVGTQKFARVKVGIDHPVHGTVVSHVLGKFTKDERPEIDVAIAQAERGLADWVGGMSFDQVMNHYN
ncbi:aminoacyl-tRNA hydrolase [Limosilactobacillus equigenerosi]|uniref:Peptidyl-tRNA hydrolase n=1 Tax=Limosilactobacillus equigenerosi DSM 18793 = JCM 14505 TaxID=1423742 RepID=A0A0R1UMZ6_9LACO|nr:aminoacyl-tRNA hydrolase [Limosilactobacillus equigenerosi]KRL94630.1 Peptidyl-tRNA hydrolase (PTH) [Limosilactobacillus equigenerosi DSM 18793 = JCM 14505]MCQ2570216.1 aminoacyl-tRNA hydrolase [Limosilactobacillus sp.]